MTHISSKQRQSVIGIALITAACVAGDSMLYIVLPLYWKEFGLTALWQIGIILSINRFIRLPLNPFIGLLYRKVPLRMGILLAILLTLIATLAYGYAQSFVLLLLARALWGIAWSLLRLGGYLTIITVSTSQNRGYLMGRYNGLWGLGGLVGMIAGGTLIHLVSVQALATGLTLVALTSFLLLKQVPNQKIHSEEDTEQHARQTQGANRNETPWWKQGRVIFVLSTGFILGLVLMGIFLTTLTVLIEENITTLILFGFVLSSTALSGILQAARWAWDPFLAPWIGRRSDALQGRGRLITFALSLAAICLLLVTLKLSVWEFVLCVLAFQMTSTMLMTLTDSAVSDVASRSSKVGVMTSYTVAVDVGAAVGPLLAFLIIDLWDIQVLYWLAALIFAVLAFSWLKYRDGEHKAHNEIEPSVR